MCVGVARSCQLHAVVQIRAWVLWYDSVHAVGKSIGVVGFPAFWWIHSPSPAQAAVQAPVVLCGAGSTCRVCGLGGAGDWSREALNSFATLSSVMMLLARPGRLCTGVCGVDAFDSESRN